MLKKDWVVNIQPAGNGEAVLKYLAPYVHRVAISDNRIVTVDEQRVTYTVKPIGRQGYVTRQLTGQQFVRSFCQHILPSRFQKVRDYGFMSHNCKLKLAEVGWLVWLYKGWTYWLGSGMFQPEVVKPPAPPCSECGGELELLSITNERGQTIWRNRLAVHSPPRGPP